MSNVTPLCLATKSAYCACLYAGLALMDEHVEEEIDYGDEEINASQVRCPDRGQLMSS
jgi:hypothetical protein